MKLLRNGPILPRDVWSIKPRHGFVWYECDIAGPLLSPEPLCMTRLGEAVSP